MFAQVSEVGAPMLGRRHSQDDVNLSANKLGGSYRSIHFIGKARDAICKVLVTYVQ